MNSSSAGSVSRQSFDFVRRLLRDSAGIEIAEDKQYLVNSRLNVVARSYGWNGPDQVVSNLQRSPTPKLKREVIEALTTNETFFFRDNHPFQLVKEDILPELMKNRQSNRRIRIWSAACSTGQEPYSLAILLNETLPASENWSYDILATDIDTGALARAKQGHYRQHEMSRGLPSIYLARYFKRQGAHWEVNPHLKQHIRFEPLNLAAPWPRQGKFDLIFLRNVLIYFSTTTKGEILRRMSNQLSDDGLLILGAGETALGMETGLQRVSKGKSAIYRNATSRSAVA